MYIIKGVVWEEGGGGEGWWEKRYKLLSITRIKKQVDYRRPEACYWQHSLFGKVMLLLWLWCTDDSSEKLPRQNPKRNQGK